MLRVHRSSVDPQDKRWTGEREVRDAHMLLLVVLRPSLELVMSSVNPVMLVPSPGSFYPSCRASTTGYVKYAPQMPAEASGRIHGQ